jgi:beta-glucosidase
MKKQYVYRGLAASMAMLFSFSCVAGSIAEGYKSTIDTQLGTHSESFVSESSADEPLYDKFVPSEEVLNADGTGNSHALIQKAINLNEEQAAEGAVLLKNNQEEGQGLPLKSGSNVTLLGIRSEVPLIGSSFGVKSFGGMITLRQALSENKTDFAHTIATGLNRTRPTDPAVLGPTTGDWNGDEFEFEGAGLNINPTMPEIYTKLNEKYGHANNEAATHDYDPGEPSMDELASVNASFRDSFSKYSDAAIVVISRPSAESTDYLPGSVAPNLGADEPLALTTNEKDEIALAKEASDNVIVLINTAQAIEIGDLKNDPEIDSILWIGYPGCYGFLGIADIISGKVSPSGALPDIFPTYNMSSPAMQNMGDFQYTNADQITRGGGQFGAKVGTYIIEAEGLYTGYRYYETRYYDAVNGKGNATSPVGAYADTTAWNYDKEVVYGFGYGLSYTNFDYEMEGEPALSVTKNDNGSYDAYATFNVKVTNTGSVAGKTPVQIYGQAPYTEGGLEKVAVQLLNYEKSEVLEPGESQTVPVKVDLQYIASYDSEAENADGTKGTYVLDPGTYYFATGNGAHLALNNMMALADTEADKLQGESNASAAVSLDIDESVIPRAAFAVSKNGGEISNQISYADWNYFQEGEVTYLTRSDWAGTFPKTYDSMTLTSQELIDDLNGKYYTIATNDDTSAIKWGQSTDTKFYQMREALIHRKYRKMGKYGCSLMVSATPVMWRSMVRRLGIMTADLRRSALRSRGFFIEIRQLRTP